MLEPTNGAIARLLEYLESATARRFYEEHRKRRRLREWENTGQNANENANQNRNENPNENENENPDRTTAPPNRRTQHRRRGGEDGELSGARAPYTASKES